MPVGVHRNRNCHLGAFGLDRLRQPFDEVGGQERGVARRRDEPAGAALLEPGHHAGQRPGEVGHGIGDHGHAERLIGG
ncbi:hypothetical protein D3C81_1643220 [compost metagenome]